MAGWRSLVRMSAVSPRRTRPGTLSGLFVVVIAAADEAAYALALYGQGGPADSRVFFVASFIAALGGLGMAGLLVASPGVRSFAYGFTTLGGLVLGILGAFSIGLPLVALGLLSIYALGRVPGRSWRALLAGSVTAAVLLVVGFATIGPF